MRISEFDLWRPGYAGATVSIFVAGTTTLANIFTDEALTVTASNPQTLATLTQDDISYGKFLVPLYTGQAYYLDIDGTNQGGVSRPPLVTLDSEDASKAVVTPIGASVASALDKVFGRVVWAEDQGTFGTSASTNNALIVAAIGVVAAFGGGTVMLPHNQSIPYTQFTLPAGVVLEGYGRVSSPTILWSVVGDKTVTIGGRGAGFRNLVLDGVSKQAGSIGIYSKANNEIVLDNVLIKRFETPIHCKGGRRMAWRELYIDACTNGPKLYGDSDAGGGSGGDTWQNNHWDGGLVSNCTGTVLDLSYEDLQVRENTIRNVGFEDNTGTATRINGARATSFPGCWWARNTVDFLVQDDSDTSKTDNTVIGLHVSDGSVAGGAVASTSSFSGLCQDVVFDNVHLSKTTVTLTSPSNNILWRDCIEDSDVTLAGEGTRIVRQQTTFGDMPSSSVVTTSATETTGFGVSLNPGERCNIEAIVVANQRNAEAYAMYHIARNAHRPGSTLAYDAQTANFTLGAVLTGGTSGATARIIGDTDAGATGTLILKDILGVFIDNEPLTDSSGAVATADGILAPQNAALLGSTTSIQAAIETDAAWACDFAVASGNVEVHVTGAAAKTIDWVVSAKVTVN